MPASKAEKSRKWCFTLNNPKGGAEIYGDDWVVEYLIVGHEIAPTTGTPHHQGYVRFKNPIGLGGKGPNPRGGVRKLLPTAAWFACKGTEEDNYDYCSKDRVTVIEYGEREAPDPNADPDEPAKGQGKRNDIRYARRLVKAGAGMAEICDKIDSYQGIRAAETFLKYMEIKRSWIPEVIWIYGPTGVGKTHLAHELCETEPWTSLDTGRWFEGYDAHEDVIFDDIRGDFCKFHVLLRLLDRYEYRIEVKGASRQFLARRIFVTTCKPPHELYKDRAGEDLMQLGRRITTIIWMEKTGTSWQAPGRDIGRLPTVPYLVPSGSDLEATHPALEPEQKSGVILANGLPASKCVGQNSLPSPCSGPDLRDDNVADEQELDDEFMSQFELD
nr:putative replication associated protein [Crucivirus sp.]